MGTASDQVGFSDSASLTSRESISTRNENLSLISLLVPARALSGPTGRKGVNAMGRSLRAQVFSLRSFAGGLESVISRRMRVEN